MNRFRTLVIVTAFSSLSVAAQTGGVGFLGNVNIPHGGPGPNFGFYYASCWGYVAPDGHEYALMGCYGGTSIIDLDAVPMQEVAFIPGANSEWKELKTWGQYAYAVSENSGMGLQIINLSQLPDTAWLVRSVSSVEGRSTARSHTITVADGYLYLNGGSYGVGGALILGLEDPENPSYAGEHQQVYFHDTYVRGDTLYGAAINGQGVYIVNVASKRVPVTMGILTYPGSGTHNTWAAIGSRHVFTSDEIGSTQKNMKVFDITSLPTFTQLTPFTANPAAIIHNIHGRGNYIYMAHYSAGSYVADVHNVNNIQNVGGYDTYPGGSSGYIGSWGVYPYFPSGRWIASDTQTGLYVFNFNQLQPRARPNLISPATGSIVNKNAALNFKWKKAAVQAEDPHYYELHINGPGVNMTVKTRDTSVAVGPVTGLVNNQWYNWHVLVRDEFTMVAGLDTFSFRPSQVSQLVAYGDDWNLLSIPLEVADGRVTTLFPNAVSSAFQYTTGAGYSTEDTLKNARGYWLKFPVSTVTTYNGLPRPLDSVDVVPGWNLIGTPSVYTPVTAIQQIPSGILSTPFYGFSSAGYVSAATLQLGRGYWVKASQAGVIVLKASSPESAVTIDNLTEK